MKQMTSPTAFPHLWTTAGLKSWRFLRHAVEMCMAMCIGIMVLDVAYVWVAAQFGTDEPFLGWPELSVLVVALNMTAPMVAWMRLRGMEWRPVIEMSAAMLVEAVVILIAYWAGVIQNAAAGNTSTLWAWQHALMMPAMLVPMFLRLDMYTGGMPHHTTQPTAWRGLRPKLDQG
jgi:hypothetical protein